MQSMSKDIIYSGQSFFNKVVECTGDIDNAFAMMLLNKSTSLTTSLEVGKVLKLTTITDHDVVDFFNDNNRPATGNNKIAIDNSLEYLFPGEFPFSF
jgi:L-fucose isomerase-like protein